jgi:hypothetical protein
MDEAAMPRKLPSEAELMRYKGYAVQEIGGRDRKEAIEKAFAFMDAHSKGRKTTAAERYEVIRVRNLGFSSKEGSIPWWAVHYRLKRRSEQ